MTTRNLLTVRQFSEKHPAFPVGGIRWQIFHSATNGMDEAGVILRVGRKVLLDEDRYFQLLDKKNGVQAQNAA